MGRRSPWALAGVFLALAAAVPAIASARPSAAGEILYQQVALSGKAEKPHGQADGSGMVTICVDQTKNIVFYGFTALVVNGQPTGGHIHKGAVGVSGPAVVAFELPGMIDPSTGELEWSGAANASKGIVSALVSTPQGFYVNVPTPQFRNGAVRGQLGAWKKINHNAAVTTCGAY
jgi:hypothetical protein